jgi:hypothetical protein
MILETPLNLIRTAQQGLVTDQLLNSRSNTIGASSVM